jgi:hypothetical protein
MFVVTVTTILAVVIVYVFFTFNIGKRLRARLRKIKQGGPNMTMLAKSKWEPCHFCGDPAFDTADHRLMVGDGPIKRRLTVRVPTCDACNETKGAIR